MRPSASRLKVVQKDRLEREETVEDPEVEVLEPVVRPPRLARGDAAHVAVGDADVRVQDGVGVGVVAHDVLLFMEFLLHFV